jgi:hypothetical protein
MNFGWTLHEILKLEKLNKIGSYHGAELEEMLTFQVYW